MLVEKNIVLMSIVVVSNTATTFLLKTTLVSGTGYQNIGNIMLIRRATVFRVLRMSHKQYELPAAKVNRKPNRFSKQVSCRKAASSDYLRVSCWW